MDKWETADMKITIEVSKMMQMYNPPHPGEIIKELCLEPLGLTVTRAAEALGVSRKTLSAILNGRVALVLKWPFGFRWLLILGESWSTSKASMICGCRKINKN